MAIVSRETARKMSKSSDFGLCLAGFERERWAPERRGCFNWATPLAHIGIFVPGHMMVMVLLYYVYNICLHPLQPCNMLMLFLFGGGFPLFQPLGVFSWSTFSSFGRSHKPICPFGGHFRKGRSQKEARLALT